MILVRFPMKNRQNEFFLFSTRLLLPIDSKFYCSSRKNSTSNFTTNLANEDRTIAFHHFCQIPPCNWKLFRFSHKSPADVQIDSRKSIKLIKISTYRTKESRAYSSLRLMRIKFSFYLLLFPQFQRVIFPLTFWLRYVSWQTENTSETEVQTERTIRVTRNFQTAGAFLQPNIENCLTQRKVNELVLQCFIHIHVSLYSISSSHLPSYSFLLFPFSTFFLLSFLIKR